MCYKFYLIQNMRNLYYFSSERRLCILLAMLVSVQETYDKHTAVPFIFKRAQNGGALETIGNYITWIYSPPTLKPKLIETRRDSGSARRKRLE